MSALLGLPGFSLVDLHELDWEIQCAVMQARSPCPICKVSGNVVARGEKTVRVMDTPMRGKPTALLIKCHRFSCSACAGSKFAGATPGINPRWNATDRLIAYIENAVTKRPLAVVSKETGLPEGSVRDIALELADRLERGHCFPTPAVLAIDGLTIKRTDYMVVADGIAGHAIGLIGSTGGALLRSWMEERLDFQTVKVFVSDMHTTNISIASTELAHAIHVADKWHILRGYQLVISKIVNKRIDDLRKASGNKKAATTVAQANSAATQLTANPDLLYEYKPAIMAINLKKRRSRKKRNKPQFEISFDMLKEVYRTNPIVRRAVWARHDLTSFYRSETLDDAMVHLERFRRRTAPFAGLEEMGDFNTMLVGKARPITNYFQPLRPLGIRHAQRVTTNALERRNAAIKKIWRSGHGIRNLSLLRLRTLYEPWVIGHDIVRCASTNCDNYIGPFLGPWLPNHLCSSCSIDALTIAPS